MAGIHETGSHGSGSVITQVLKIRQNKAVVEAAMFVVSNMNEIHAQFHVVNENSQAHFAEPILDDVISL